VAGRGWRCGLAKKARSEGIDQLRGFAILLVIVGHSIQYSNGRSYFRTEAFFENPLYRLIYGFHMPLFMAISGYLFSGAIASRGLWSLFQARLRSLIVPILAWGLAIYILEKKLVNHAQFPMNPVRLLMGYVAVCVHSLWFLWAVFYCTLAAALIHKLQRYRWPTYLGIGVLLFLVPDEGNAYMYKFMYPYFVLPIAWREMGLDTKWGRASRWWKVMTLSIALAGYAVAMHLWHKDFYIYTSHFTLLGRNVPIQLKNDLARWLTGVFGVVAVVAAGALIGERSDRIGSWLAGLGRQSLGLYIVSGLLFSYGVSLVLSNARFSWIMTSAVMLVVTLMSLGATLLIRRFPGLGLLLLGGRA